MAIGEWGHGVIGRFEFWLHRGGGAGGGRATYRVLRVSMLCMLGIKLDHWDGRSGAGALSMCCLTTAWAGLRNTPTGARWKNSVHGIPRFKVGDVFPQPGRPIRLMHGFTGRVFRALCWSPWSNSSVKDLSLQRSPHSRYQPNTSRQRSTRLRYLHAGEVDSP